jgi:KDO2-lipid IV(A) lauroyltransferase
LPFKVVYILSDVFYFITYYLISYRKKVVISNLQLTFPELTPKEHQQIAKAFYKHLCDVFLELIKMLSISRREMLKRFKIINPQLIKELEAKNKSIIFLYGHYMTTFIIPPV